MTLLNSYAMNGNINTFREGAGRHNRDRAKTNRDFFIDHANQIVRRGPADTPSTTLTVSRTSLSVLQDHGLQSYQLCHSLVVVSRLFLPSFTVKCAPTIIALYNS